MLKNNKILFINPAGWQKESINLGLSYLSGALKKAGYSILILDINRHEMSDNVLAQRVIDCSPGIIGISIKTATANEGGRVANLLSSICPDAHFLVGGPHVTLCADSYLKDFPVFEYGLMGETEESIVELADALSNDKPIDSIEGLIFRKNGQIIINRWCPPKDLNNLPLPDLDSIEGFDWRGFRYPMVTSRGCPFQCTYCCVNKLTGSRKWRWRSVKNVVDELEYIARSKDIKLFEIWDDNFTLDIKRAKEICRELIGRHLSLSWHCHNGIRADRIDRELATLMKQAGCTSVAFGIESGNSEVFDSIKKGEPLSAIVNAVKLVKEAGIEVVGYFIIGLPGDTLDKFIETVRFQRSLKLDHHIFGMLIPYPKTEVWDIVQTHGKMLSNITSTQHFSSDIVPVSFELPDFPKQDMVRAFYIARFFELFKAVQQLIDNAQMPVVVYMMTPQINEYLPGMLIACNSQTRHIIVGETDEAAVSKSRFFSQVPEGLNINYCRTIPHDLPKNTTIFVCNKNFIPTSLLLSNTTMFLISSNGFECLIIQMRKHIERKLPVPEPVLSIIGYSKYAPNIIKQYGMKKICRLILKRIKRKIKVLLIMAINLLLVLYHTIHMASAKKELQLMKHAKRDFPYDDYSSYM